MNERTVRLQVNSIKIQDHLVIQLDGKINGITAYYDKLDNVKLCNPIIEAAMENKDEYSQNLALLELSLVLKAIENFPGYDIEVENLQFGSGNERAMDALDQMINDIKGYTLMANYVPQTKFETITSQRAFDKIRDGVDDLHRVELIRPKEINDLELNFDDSDLPY
ncbi:hypothetical protein [Furfurilactobacillus curtus]|uniref:Uncharacterized protein n=1 Tax=Furfurilactobacillus curtus TaxID=1746200 RepID=A0ABQ5JMX2_9LACO